jgi:GDP-mannose transporter
MTLGAVFAGFNDLEYNFVGYCWMAINCVFTAAYTLYMRYATTHIQLSKFGMVYYNNLLSMCILFIVCVLKNDFALAANPQILTASFVFWTALAGVCGFGLNFASLWCVSSTSATTYAIVGSLNKIPVTLLGFILFNAKMTPEGIGFVCMATLGGFMFAYSKLPASITAAASSASGGGSTTSLK